MLRLMSKTSELGKATVFYPIRTGDVHGFQIGDPRLGGVQVKVFDAEDRELWIFLRAPGGTFTQAQVNGLVASIHWID